MSANWSQICIFDSEFDFTVKFHLYKFLYLINIQGRPDYNRNSNIMIFIKIWGETTTKWSTTRSRFQDIYYWAELHHCTVQIGMIREEKSIPVPTISSSCVQMTNTFEQSPCKQMYDKMSEYNFSISRDLGYSWRSITRSSSPSYLLPWKLDDPGESSFSLKEILTSNELKQL